MAQPESDHNSTKTRQKHNKTNHLHLRSEIRKERSKRDIICMMNVFLQIMPPQSVGTIFVLLQSRMLAPFRFGKGLPNFVGKKIIGMVVSQN